MVRLTNEERSFREDLRAFFATEIPLEVREALRLGVEIPLDGLRENMRTLHGAGLAVPHWPVEWGGQDWSTLQRHIWLQEMDRAFVPPPNAFNTQMVGPVLAQFGTEEQKARFLPETASGDLWWCQGFSEPEAGSDLASLRTAARPEGADWLVNGQKIWTTRAQDADFMIALVRTDPHVRKQAGISVLLVDMRSEGVTVRPIRLIDGRDEVCEVFFDDVHVPAENLVGEVNGGWTIAKFLLGNERVGVAPVNVIKRVLTRLKLEARHTIGADPLLRARIAELETDLLALELTALRVVAHSSGGEPHPASSVLKLRGTELQQAVSELALEVAGPAAVGDSFNEVTAPEWRSRTSPSYLGLRAASIYGGSNEIQRQIIARTILGL
jgi:alkylation response protein AidB-like acyl-CoA dehydrogenase